MFFNPFSALTLFVGQQEGHLACKNECQYTGDLIGAPVVTTIFIISCCNIIHDGDILAREAILSPQPLDAKCQ